MHGSTNASGIVAKCAPAYGIVAPNALLDVAFFLLTRGPWSWIAGGPMLGWHMSHWWTAGKARRICGEHRLGGRHRPRQGHGGKVKPFGR